jgi:hypothetical protein
MFNGVQGRQYVEQTLPQIQQSQMPEDQKRVLIQLLQSVLALNTQQASQTQTRAPGLTLPYTVHEEAMTAGSNVAYNG